MEGNPLAAVGGADGVHVESAAGDTAHPFFTSEDGNGFIALERFSGAVRQDDVVGGFFDGMFDFSDIVVRMTGQVQGHDFFAGKEGVFG